jgi:hypothetical protein
MAMASIKLQAEYPELVEAFLERSFPGYWFSEVPDKQFEKQLPLFQWRWLRSQLTLHFICRHRLNIAKFFFEMIHRWLIPGRRLDVSSLFSSDFHFHLQPQTLYTVAEITVRVDPALSRDQIEHNLKVIETELRLGIISVYHASRLLETHFTSPQQKNSQIQEKLTKLLQRNPDVIDYDIFGQLQHFMVLSREEFKTHRSAGHLSRLVAASYVFTKSIEIAREKLPDQRHVRLKLSPVVLDLPWGPKEVMGICVGLSLLYEGEIFEERHLFRALQSNLPGLKVVADSFYSHEGHAKGVTVLYLEIEKEDGSLMTPLELKNLKKNLPDEIRKSVEVPLKSIFMPRNEEEILRYIVALSGELRSVKHCPQVILMFDEQKGGEIYFTVVLVRILLPTSYSIQYLFGQNSSPLKFTPDRVKRVGLLRKRYPKEATVFRVHLSSHAFLREDQTVDLFRARQFVFQELEKVIGSLRDYTGGMIAKQVELIDQVQLLLSDPSSTPLLESFFHAIYPVEARSFLAPEQVKNWFLLWKQLLEFPEDQFKMDRDHSAIYLMGLDCSVPELDPADFDETQLMIVRPSHDQKYIGYLFVTADLEEQQLFISKLQSVLSLSLSEK